VWSGTALRVAEVSPGACRLATRYENWYVLVSGGRVMVLDAGLPGHSRDFSAVLARLGHTVADINAVLITRDPPDQAGNAERMRELDARVLCHPAEWCSSCRVSQEIFRSPAPARMPARCTLLA
jgi:glyoxylase-like metal-dependent hydrolase (beta-lactamase superfamily II)